MTDIEEMVESFHHKHGFAVGAPLESESESADVAIKVCEVSLEGLELQLLRHPDFGSDRRLQRAHLMIEELGELLRGMRLCDPVMTCDGIADLAYVTAGTGVTFGLPVDAAIEEVHRSNMTKDGYRQHKPSKGANFRPPDIARVIEEHRKRVAT